MPSKSRSPPRTNAATQARERNPQGKPLSGTAGTVAFLAGSVGGGYFTAWIGLKRALPLLILAMNLPNLVFCYLSAAQPTSLTLIAAALAVEMFGYGFGFVGIILFIMQVVARGRFQTAHYALGTGFMQLGLVLSNLALLLFSANYRSVPVSYASKTIYWDLKMGGQTVSLSFSFAMLEVSDSLILAQKQQHFPITKAIYELFQLIGLLGIGLREGFFDLVENDDQRAAQLLLSFDPGIAAGEFAELHRERQSQ